MNNVNYVHLVTHCSVHSSFEIFASRNVILFYGITINFVAVGEKAF